MIAILMATYNGEKYIKSQIESLLTQTVQGFKIYVHDDCSTDNTYRILEFYALRYPDTFVISRNERNTGGAKNNFMQMMVQHKADYVMLCDQDDVWKPDKAELTIKAMREMEQAHGLSVPILVHTDLEVVNQQLKHVSSSFLQMTNLCADCTALRQSIVQNVVTGCTIMYNRALAELIFAAPADIIMHDWWLLLIASAFGKIHYVSQPTILYRQHQENSVGAKHTRALSYKVERFLHRTELKQTISATYRQAERFLSTFDERLSIEQKRLIQEYCFIPSQRKPMRLYHMLKLGTWKHGALRKIAQMMFI